MTNCFICSRSSAEDYCPQCQETYSVNWNLHQNPPAESASAETLAALDISLRAAFSQDRFANIGKHRLNGLAK